MDLKELFKNGALTYDQFMEACTEANAKIVDLSEGNYVSKQKYTDELASRDTRITTLNDTITQRDTDLATLQQTLKDAGDIEALKNASSELTKLQTKYQKDMEKYQAQLARQSYEFAVKEFAGSKKFTSNAAKRDFVQSMLSKNLQMEKGAILGAEDFVTAYAQDNADAFVADNPTPEPTQTKPLPTFVQPTPGPEQATDPTGGFADAFHFTPIHPVKSKD